MNKYYHKHLEKFKEEKAQKAHGRSAKAEKKERPIDVMNRLIATHGNVHPIDRPSLLRLIEAEMNNQ